MGAPSEAGVSKLDNPARRRTGASYCAQLLYAVVCEGDYIISSRLGANRGERKRKEVRMKKNCRSVLFRTLVIVMVAAFMAPRTAHAQANADARIERLETALKAMQAELAQLKAEYARDAAKPAPVVDQKKIDQMVIKAIDQRARLNRVRCQVGSVPLRHSVI